jgi:amino acid transporter
MAYLAALPLRADKMTVLERIAKLRTAESEAASQEANIKHLEATLARAEMEILVAQQELARCQEQGEIAMAGAIQQAIAHQQQDIELVKKSLKDRATDSAQMRQRIQDLDAEVAFARGIDQAKDDRVGTAVLERASPTLGVPLMAIAIMISTFGCVNGLVLMGPRLYYAMARDKLFFQSVGQLNQNGVPAWGLILQGLWSIVLIFSGTYGDLLDYIVFAALLFYVLTVTGLFVLRKKQPNAERPYRAIGYPVVPALYVTLCALIMLDLLVVKPVYSWPSFLIVLAGIPVFFLWRKRAMAR